MKQKLFILAALLCTLPGIYFFIARRAVSSKKPFFTTQVPTRKTIRQTITTTGSLQIKDSSKVGSLISGTVQDILVKENEHVKKGQLLALLDNGKADTAIRHAQGRLERAQAEYEFYKNVFTREKALFEHGHSSAQEFEVHTRNMLVSKGDMISAQALLDVAKIEFDNTHIKAPEEGIIISIDVQKGFKVTTDLNATVLFEIARDIHQMEAKLEIDESDISLIAPGQKVRFTVDSYPGKVFKGHISDISFAPINRSANNLTYQATLSVSNANLLLRPGMTVHATIKIAKAKDALGIAMQSLYFDDQAMKYLAEQAGYAYKPLSYEEKKQCLNCPDQKHIKFVWVVDGKTLQEKPVTLGAKDASFTQVIDGIAENERLITDVEQDNKMNALYKKIFSGAL